MRHKILARLVYLFIVIFLSESQARAVLARAKARRAQRAKGA